MTSKTISIVGAGQVGLVLSLRFYAKNYRVICVDNDVQKVSRINSGTIPFYDDEGTKLLSSAISEKMLCGTTDIAGAIGSSDITFVCVDTPLMMDGMVDLSGVIDVSKAIGSMLLNKNNYHTIVIKSTVPPGTTMEVVRPILERYSRKFAGEGFGLCVCPEFLQEGTSVQDSIEPSRLIIGVMDERTRGILMELYEDFHCPKLFKDPNTAEMIKYCTNSFLATKISFANEFANLCEKLGVDVDDMFEGVSLDNRIAPHFFGAGIGYGGSCLPKDTRGLLKFANSMGVDMKVLSAVDKVNRAQVFRLIEILREYGAVEGKIVSVLGLAFKPGTDDVRGTLAIPVIETLLVEGAKVKAYDPKANDRFKGVGIGGNITFYGNYREALLDSHAVLFLTEWSHFKNITEEEFLELMSFPLIIDGRRIFKGVIFDKAIYRTIGTSPN